MRPATVRDPSVSEGLGVPAVLPSPSILPFSRGKATNRGPAVPPSHRVNGITRLRRARPSPAMITRQVVVAEPFKTAVREVDLASPAPNQILVQTEVSAVSAGTELAVYTGTHQWLKDPSLPDWKFPFKPGYSAAGTVVSVGSDVRGWKVGDRVSYPGNHASSELLTIGHERGRLWRMPPHLSFEKAGRGRAGETGAAPFDPTAPRRYVGARGAPGNWLWEPAPPRLAGAWDIDKAQNWLLAALASGRLNLEGLVTHRIEPGQLGEAYE